MDYRISATDLARTLGDVLARVRYRGESFVVERNGRRIARVCPLAANTQSSLRDALTAWREAGKPEPQFADDLDRVGRADHVAADPWAS